MIDTALCVLCVIYILKAVFINGEGVPLVLAFYLGTHKTSFCPTLSRATSYIYIYIIIEHYDKVQNYLNKPRVSRHYMLFCISRHRK